MVVAGSVRMGVAMIVSMLVVMRVIAAMGVMLMGMVVVMGVRSAGHSALCLTACEPDQCTDAAATVSP